MSDTPADPPGLDLARLRVHLDRELPGLVRGPLRAELIEGGRSNLTYVLSDGASSWVLRRPPLGHVLATAHDMGREYRVMTALRATPVPVPDTHLLVEDTEVIGATWYLMSYVPGVAHRDAAALTALGPERVRALGLGLAETLVRLHAIDPAAVGLADFGRPEGYLARQLRRWSTQLAASRSRELPGVDALHALLTERLPDSPAPTLVHGDYRLDNVLVDGEDRITAVLDWEMSTLGDPLTDLGLLVMYTELAGAGGGIIPAAATAPGYPAAPELVARYAELSGRDVSTLGWYVAFASFKLAVVAEGIHFRYQQGKTLGAGFERAGEMGPILVDHGLAALKEH
ncbi:acyl-CoA dehydrogenase [Kitasatospora herbaricolor]|uniref:phosphotransferase family protein n=1 Tax=Kitasatospora herbaricolor TaxID=68217 RepID=UPI00174856D3|nr:phosphotransferase family protein [Kitasatospora herbaricolor]MDQ0306483.1 aminoglycoside phosphotransferase (APT) family kinase protein [Kitasatospora herbaricolor]GGV46162.1 acyl-CoA dehydrogenase [Kitasatospora herbaricolor]